MSDMAATTLPVLLPSGLDQLCNNKLKSNKFAVVDFYYNTWDENLKL